MPRGPRLPLGLVAARVAGVDAEIHTISKSRRGEATLSAITSGWKTFQSQLAAHHTARDLGFPCKDGDVSRFLARYRLADSFRGVTLDRYAAGTVAAYSSLLRLFLAWSAFEQFAVVIGLRTRATLEHDRIDALLARHPSPRATVALRSTGRTFLEYMTTFVDSPSLKARILGRNQDPPSAGSVARGLRHTFAHGPLTVHGGGKRPKRLSALANALADWLLDVMRVEFEERVSRYVVPRRGG